MQALGGEHMGLQPPEDRLQHRATGADLIGQRRQAQIHALAGVALGLPVQRLMLTELLEQDHGEQAGPGPAARDHMERCRRLADGLTVTARELLTHVLDHLPLTGNDLQRLGDVLAELGEARTAAAGAGRRSGHDDPLPGQVLRKWLARGPLAREGGNVRGPGRGHLGGELILGGRSLQLLEL